MFTMQIKGCRSALFTVPSCTLSLSVWQLPLCFDSAVQCSSQHGRVSPPPPPPPTLREHQQSHFCVTELQWHFYCCKVILVMWLPNKNDSTLFLLPKCIFAVQACWLIFAKEKKQTKQNWKALLVKDVSIHLVHLTKYSLRHHKKCMVILLCTFSIDKLPVSRPGSHVSVLSVSCVLISVLPLSLTVSSWGNVNSVQFDCAYSVTTWPRTTVCVTKHHVCLCCAARAFLFFFEVQEIFSLLILLSWSAADSLNSPFRICFGHESRRSVPTWISADVSRTRRNVYARMQDPQICSSALTLKVWFSFAAGGPKAWLKTWIT